MIRKIIRRLPIILSSMGLIFMSQLVMASSDSGTLTAGSRTVTCPHGVGSQVGFSNTALFGTYGSYSPTGLTGGSSVATLIDQIQVSCLNNHSFLVVSGFSSDPGSSWLTSVACNGVTNLQSGSVGYSFSGGNAEWVWNNHFGFTAGSNYSCTIVHN